MQELDDVVGVLLKKIDDLGIADNTIVVFTTDNGAEKISWPDGGATPFRGEKGYTWEGGFRVPCLVRWPGLVKPGTVINGIVSHEDWAVTLLAAAGEPDIKEKLLKGHTANGKAFKVQLDGYDQRELLAGTGPSKRNEIFYFDDNGNLNAVRVRDWKAHFALPGDTGLPTAVLYEDARVSTQRGIGVENGACQTTIELRVGVCGVELTQDHLAMRPGKFKDTIRQTPVLVFLNQLQAHVPGLADAGDDNHRRRFFRVEYDPVSDRDNRIENGSLAAGEGRRIAQRLRISDGVSPADELRAVGLIGYLPNVRPLDTEKVKHPWSRLVKRARPARAENRPVLADNLRLNKEIAERRVQRIAAQGSLRPALRESGKGPCG